ncbi:MAG: type II toxin-antitoxin system VapC family toxin [Chloroflexota bacterium]
MDDLATTFERHVRVGIDTSIFIYHIEAFPRYAVVAGAALTALADGRYAGITSVLTLMELAVKPLQLGRPEVADEYELLLGGFPNLSIANVDRLTSRRASELRAAYRLRPADAVQVGTSLRHGATAFLTNDRDLRRVKELQVIVLDDYVSA